MFSKNRKQITRQTLQQINQITYFEHFELNNVLQTNCDFKLEMF